MAGETTFGILLCGSLSLWVIRKYERTGGFQFGDAVATGELGAKFRAGAFTFFVYLFGLISLIYNLAFSNFLILSVDALLIAGFLVMKKRIKSNVEIDEEAKKKRLRAIQRRRERAAERWENGIEGFTKVLGAAGSVLGAVDEYIPEPNYESQDHSRTKNRRGTKNTGRSTDRSGGSRPDSIVDYLDIEGKVDPLAVRSTAAEIAGDMPSGGGGSFSYQQVAEIHRYVNQNISYVPDPANDNYIAPPDETLNTGAGDCDCQAVLVASLFEAIGASTRLVFCNAPDGGHALSEVRLASSPSETSEVTSALGSYYGSAGYTYSTFAYDSDDDGFWYPADTAMGRYVGDIGQLSDNGYIRRSSDGSWSWHEVEYYYP